MKFMLITLISAAVVVASGVVHGLNTGRWGVPESIAAAAERLDQIPMTIAESWDGQPLDEIPQRQLDQAGAVGYITRRYVNRQNGSAVNVLVLCGHKGPIATHPPTVCFTGSGFMLKSAPTRRTVADAESIPLGEFWHGDFRKDSDGIRTVVRTLWAWNATGKWEAPDNPRITYGPYNHLHKMYVTRDVTASDLSVDEDPCLDFLRQFIVELDDILLTAGSKSE